MEPTTHYFAVPTQIASALLKFPTCAGDVRMYRTRAELAAAAERDGDRHQRAFVAFLGSDAPEQLADHIGALTQASTDALIRILGEANHPAGVLLGGTLQLDEDAHSGWLVSATQVRALAARADDLAAVVRAGWTPADQVPLDALVRDVTALREALRRAAESGWAWVVDAVER